MNLGGSGHHHGEPGPRAFHRAVIGALAAPAGARAASLGPIRRIGSWYMLRAADRRLAAQAEGIVAIYTSLNTLDSVPLTAAFEKKPASRHSSGGRRARKWSNARLPKLAPPPAMSWKPTVRRWRRSTARGSSSSSKAPHFADLPPAAFPKHRHYVADRFNFFTIAYNTKLIGPNDVPRSARTY